MKPTLDEEIRKRALQLLEDLQHGSHEHDDQMVEQALLAFGRLVREEDAKVCEAPEPECCGRVVPQTFEHPAECCGEWEPRDKTYAECAAAIRAKALE